VSTTPEVDADPRDTVTAPTSPRAFTERRKKPLSACVEIALAHYFNDLDGHVAGELYEMFMSEVEPPLIRSVLQHTRGNQTRAAEILGINRNTLRKKIERYGITTPRRRRRGTRR